MTRQIELFAGTVDYEDTAGEGVLLGGLMMDAAAATPRRARKAQAAR